MQLPFVDEDYFSLFIGLSLSILALVAYAYWSIQNKRKCVAKLNQILDFQSNISVVTASQELSRKPLDRKSVLGIVELAENAILSFSGMTILSLPVMETKFKEQLVNSHVLNPGKEAMNWSITEDKVADIVEALCQKEKLDVLRTKSGEYLLVPDLKEKLRDTLQLQGRIDTLTESQRLQVEQDELLELIRSWNWNAFETRNGKIISLRWVRWSLESEIRKKGYLSPADETIRLEIQEQEITKIAIALHWKLVKTLEGNLVPEHLVEEKLVEFIEDGLISPVTLNEQLHITKEQALRLLAKSGHRVITSEDDSILTLSQISRMFHDDIELLGIIDPQVFSDRYQVPVTTIIGLVKDDERYRKNPNGHYISLRVLREWFLETVRENGLVNIREAEEKWGLSNLDILSLMKRFGLRTTITRDGDYLSLAWARRNARAQLESGKRINPQSLMDSYGIKIGTAEAILADIETEAMMNSEGALIPYDVIRAELSEEFKKHGILNPIAFSKHHGYDLTEIQRILSRMSWNALRTPKGVLVSRKALVDAMRSRLKQRGVFDVGMRADAFGMDYSVLASELEANLLDGQYLIDACGVVVTVEWVDQLRKTGMEKGQLRVTEHAKSIDLKRSVFICLLRRLFKGSYLPGADTFFILTESNR